MKYFLLLALFLGAFVFSDKGHFFGREENLCIVKKDIMITPGYAGIRREKIIFTDDEAYSVEDSHFVLNYNSLTTYAKLKEGKCYRVKTNNTRIGFLNWKRNVLEVLEEIKPNEVNSPLPKEEEISEEDLFDFS